MRHKSNAIVIGGGVFGAAIAYNLAKDGYAVSILDDRPIGQNASGKNAGNLNPIYKSPEKLLPLSLDSFSLHLSLVNELAEIGIFDHKINTVRRILLAFNDDDFIELRNTEKIFGAYKNFSAQLINGHELKKLEPRLSSHVQAGLLLEGNKCVDSFLLNKALLNGALHYGASLIPEKVIGLDHRGSDVVGIKTNERTLAADLVVFATGPWIESINQWLGLKLIIEPLKGQILRVKTKNEGLHFDLTHASHTLYRRGDDEIWIGVTNEKVGFDESPTEEAKKYLWEQAISIMPEIAEAQLLEHSATLRAVSPSGLPIASLAPGWDNVYVANGGAWKGALLCTGIAKIICNLIHHGKSDLQSSLESIH